MWKKSESGQSLLIIVLLVSVVFTIIATASYRLTTENQSTRLQEESIKTLAAADSGIERGVQFANDNAETAGGAPVTYSSLGINLPGVNAVESTLQVTADEGTTFMSPLVQKDEQYTFYLHKFPDGADNLTQNVRVHFSNNACPAGSAVELTLIYGANGQRLQRWVADPCGDIPGNNELPVTTTAFTLNGATVQYRVQVNLPSIVTPADPAQLLIVRAIERPTNIGFSVTTGTLYSQGQTIRSEAVSTNGVTKIVTLFKSYPQIPADFFVTRF